MTATSGVWSQYLLSKNSDQKDIPRPPFSLADIKKNALDSLSRLRRARQAIADFSIVREAQKRDAQLVHEQDALEAQYADEPLRRNLTSAVLRAIHHALLRHKRWLNKRSLQPKSGFEITDGIDEADIAARIKTIESINWLDVFNALSPQIPPMRKKS